MPFEFVLPELSSDSDEGIVVAWFKREGAQVQEGETLLEVQLAKVSYDVPAPVTGQLYRILAPRDAVIRQGQLLAVILRPGEQPPMDQAPATPATQTKPAGTATAGQAAPAREIRASPIARRLAQEQGIDLASVQASSPDGRITEADVRAAIAARAAEGRSKTTPLSPMRKTIARRMTESLHTMAQVTLTTEADVTALVALREQYKSQYDAAYTDLIMKAVALALAEHPQLNARLVGEELEQLSDVNIGLAVAVDQGLVVPVIREVNKKGLRELAGESKKLTERARASKLAEAEMTGGTFSVTNLGMYGIDAFTPIINPPEVAILGVGRIVEKPAHVDGGLQWRQMLTLSLTFDHRVVDGAPAAAFLQTLRLLIEKPDRLAE